MLNVILLLWYMMYDVCSNKNYVQDQKDLALEFSGLCHDKNDFYFKPNAAPTIWHLRSSCRPACRTYKPERSNHPEMRCFISTMIQWVEMPVHSAFHYPRLWLLCRFRLNYILFPFEKTNEAMRFSAKLVVLSRLWTVSGFSRWVIDSKSTSGGRFHQSHSRRLAQVKTQVRYFHLSLKAKIG